MQRLLDAQRAAQAADPIPDVATRRDRIDRFVAAVLEHRTELAAALDADFGGRPTTISMELDILGGMETAAFARENLETWIAPVNVPAAMGGAIPMAPVDAGIWLRGLLLMIAAGLLVGALPAMRAMRLNIVDALAGR
ncbi:MAG: hypothetical protein J0H25_12205 [Rhizobiales bacterium]|nr:hypothetical protein [Hyphomicrobiales bacterium]